MIFLEKCIEISQLLSFTRLFVMKSIVKVVPLFERDFLNCAVGSLSVMRTRIMLD